MQSLKSLIFLLLFSFTSIKSIDEACLFGRFINSFSESECMVISGLAGAAAGWFVVAKAFQAYDRFVFDRTKASLSAQNAEAVVTVEKFYTHKLLKQFYWLVTVKIIDVQGKELFNRQLTYDSNRFNKHDPIQHQVLNTSEVIYNPYLSWALEHAEWPEELTLFGMPAYSTTFGN